MGICYKVIAMLKIRLMNADGLSAFSNWLTSPAKNELPRSLLEDNALTDAFGDYVVDPGVEFASRQLFGVYLNEVLSTADFTFLMSPDSDGLWAWLAIVYFKQLTKKGIRRREHYLVVRKGPVGSLAYRHAVRTSFELVHIHGPYAEVCLRGPMYTFGEMTEALASRQYLAYNRTFFRTAYELYMKDGKLRSGASSKPKNIKQRRPGDRSGLGGARRLAIALNRLELTYDTADMESDQMKLVLPREFRRFMQDGA